MDQQNPVSGEINTPATTTTTTPPVETAPEPSAPPTQAYSAPLSDQPLPNKKFPVKLIAIASVIFVFFGLAGAFVYAGYSNAAIPLLSDKQQLEFQKTYARLPVVPKNAQHVLLLASDKSPEMNSYEFKFSAGLDLSQKQNVGGLQTLSFDISAAGSADIRDKKNPILDLDAKVKSTTPVVPLSTNTLLVVKDKKLYFNIKEFSGILTSYINLTPVLNTWFVQDISSLDTEAREMLDEKKKDEKTITEHTQQWFLKVFSDRELSSHIKKVEDQKIGDEISYHLTFSPSPQDIVKMMEYLAQEQGSEWTERDRKQMEKELANFRDVKLDLWIGQQSYLPRKTTVAFEYTPPKSSTSAERPQTTLTPFGDLSDVTFKAAFAMEIPSVNKPVNVTAPTDAVSFDEFYQRMNGSTATSNRIGMANDSGIRSDLAQIVTGLEAYATTNNGLYPVKLEDLLVDILKKIPTHPDSSEKYVYATSRSRTTALVYAKLFVPEDPEKPYYYWQSESGAFGNTDKATLDLVVSGDLSKESLKKLPK